MLKVFISYASEDYPVAKRLRTALQRRGIDPWLDDELRPGGKWNDDITGEIAASTHFVALISAHSLRDDRFVRREWDQALAQNKPFIPVRLEECALPDILKAKQWEDLFPEDSGTVRLLRFFHQEKWRGVFEESFSCDGPDNADWELQGWELDASDHTGGQSQSLHGRAGLSAGALLPQTVTRTAAIAIQIGRGRTLSYYGRLKLSAFLGEAGFSVLVDDQPVDEQSAAVDQDGWEARRVKLPAGLDRRHRDRIGGPAGQDFVQLRSGRSPWPRSTIGSANPARRRS
jgi:TIR domain